MTPHTVEHPYLRFNGNSGYSRRGDTVSLFADRIDNLDTAGTASGSLALQLWACESPYAGGGLTGLKIAEAPLGVLDAGCFLAPVTSDVPASYPESGDFAMAMVIAQWDGEGFNLVHDFHNYPNRDAFVHPRLEGQVGYRFKDENHVVVDVERIHNPRDPGNISGTLSLELWALPEPCYVAGDFAGHALAGTTLGFLAGGAHWQDCSYDLEITPPPAGTCTLVLMLREWVGNGYVTRDHSSFSHQVTFPLAGTAAAANEAPEDVPAGSAASPSQPGEAPAEAADVPDVASAAREAVSASPQDPGQTPASQKAESVSVQSSLRTLFDEMKRFALQALDRIKQQLSS